jgi:hypothetical protein
MLVGSLKPGSSTYDQKLIASKKEKFFGNLKNIDSFYHADEWEHDYQKQLHRYICMHLYICIYIYIHKCICIYMYIDSFYHADEWEHDYQKQLHRYIYIYVYQKQLYKLFMILLDIYTCSCLCTFALMYLYIYSYIYE